MNQVFVVRLADDDTRTVKAGVPRYEVVDTRTQMGVIAFLTEAAANADAQRRDRKVAERAE